MSMNEFLAQYYGNTGTDESEKTAAAEEAQFELFAKLAHDNGIDLDTLSEEQVSELYEATFKEASEEEKDEKKEEKSDEKDEDEKKAAAEAEFAEKKASQEKISEADFLGRVMAHSYVNEMRKIAQSAEKVAGDDEKEEKKDDDKDEKKEDKGDDKKMPPFMKKDASKTASAIDELGARRAVAMISEFNKTASAAGQGLFDEEVAVGRIQAVYTLGLGESTKVASAANAEAAVDVRALEYLEAAGYPVTWAE